ncbi:SulP family inorganic anion transporter [Sphingomonas sp. G124]|uniref:SulP family inorganic anion transporter n=1 Tax=Sphingomonas cremea TaxID=2904799 RepID=A0A9X1QNI8_9SPHN|nr:SulP family inorganic anion transporter [Sphingomonas cremea]MCF2515759.1 SulP family inorganic anion transporter [Sphingomonas cremea]
MAARWMAGFASIAELPRSAIPREIGAGISVAAVAIPIGLAYAKLTGVPTEIGLYASIVPTAAYALFGPSSRYLIVGPDTATCLLLGTAVTQLGVIALDARAPVVAGLSLLVGIACLAAAMLRLGFIANLISRPVLVGYLAGVSLTLLVTQLPSVSRVDIHSPGLFRPFIELGWRAAEIHWPTLSLAAALLILLRLLKRYVPRIPGPAVAIVLAILLSEVLDLPSAGFATIGAIPSGLPSPRLPSFAGDPAQLALSVAGLLVVSFSSGILTARAFGQKIDADSNPNRELAGFGAADVAAGLFQGFAVTGADSRTAVAMASGGRSALVGLVAAATVALVVTLLTGPLAALPEAALGAILVSAAVDLFDGKAFRRLAKIDRHELAFALVATVGVIWIGVLQGVFIAVAMTLVHLLRLATRPLDSVMGLDPERGDLVTLSRNPSAEVPDRIVVYLFEASLIFLNAHYFLERAIQVLRSRPDAKWLVLDTSAMMNADTGAVDAMEDLKHRLDAEGVGLLLGGGHGHFREILERSGLAELIGRDRIFDTPAQALAAAEAMRDQLRSN